MVSHYLLPARSAQSSSGNGWRGAVRWREGAQTSTGEAERACCEARKSIRGGELLKTRQQVEASGHLMKPACSGYRYFPLERVRARAAPQPQEVSSVCLAPTIAQAVARSELSCPSPQQPHACSVEPAVASPHPIASWQVGLSVVRHAGQLGRLRRRHPSGAARGSR